jgi:hypothetical protein
VDFSEGIKICHTNLSWRKSDDRAIFLVKSVNVEYALTRDNCTLQAQVREASVPRSRKVSGWACEANIEELSA